jgi:hypothetical protein
MPKIIYKTSILLLHKFVKDNYYAKACKDNANYDGQE